MNNIIITKDSDISKLDLSYNLTKKLKSLGINNIEDLCCINYNDLKKELIEKQFISIITRIHHNNYLLNNEKEKYEDIKKRLKKGEEIPIEELFIDDKLYLQKKCICNGSYIKNSLNNAFEMLKKRIVKNTFNVMDVVLLDSKIFIEIQRNNMKNIGDRSYNSLIETFELLGLKFRDKIIDYKKDIPEYADFIDNYYKEDELKAEDEILRLKQEIPLLEDEILSLNKSIQMKQLLLQKYHLLLSKKTDLQSVDNDLACKLTEAYNKLCRKLNKKNN